MLTTKPNVLKYVVLLAFVLVQLPSHAQVQEVYRKKFLLAKGFTGKPKEITLTEDGVISRSELTTPILGTPTTGANITTLTSTLQVVSGTISSNTTDITISRGAKIQETPITPLLKSTPTKYNALLANSKLAAPDLKLSSYFTTF